MDYCTGIVFNYQKVNVTSAPDDNTYDTISAPPALPFPIAGFLVGFISLMIMNVISKKRL